jgi:hypothetical protein
MESNLNVVVPKSRAAGEALFDYFLVLKNTSVALMRVLFGLSGFLLRHKIMTLAIGASAGSVWLMVKTFIKYPFIGRFLIRWLRLRMLKRKELIEREDFVITRPVVAHIYDYMETPKQGDKPPPPKNIVLVTAPSAGVLDHQRHDDTMDIVTQTHKACSISGWKVVSAIYNREITDDATWVEGAVSYWRNIISWSGARKMPREFDWLAGSINDEDQVWYWREIQVIIARLNNSNGCLCSHYGHPMPRWFSADHLGLRCMSLATFALHIRAYILGKTGIQIHNLSRADVTFARLMAKRMIERDFSWLSVDDQETLRCWFDFGPWADPTLEELTHVLSLQGLRDHFLEMSRSESSE